jgi:hypothetical protein
MRVKRWLREHRKKKTATLQSLARPETLTGFLVVYG